MGVLAFEKFPSKPSLFIETGFTRTTQEWFIGGLFKPFYFKNVTTGATFLISGFFDKIRNFCMMARMFNPISNYKIFWSVIRLNAINMMDNFRFEQSSFKFDFHYKTMLWNITMLVGIFMKRIVDKYITSVITNSLSYTSRHFGHFFTLKVTPRTSHFYSKSFKMILNCGIRNIHRLRNFCYGFPAFIKTGYEIFIKSFFYTHKEILSCQMC